MKRELMTVEEMTVVDEVLMLKMTIQTMMLLLMTVMVSVVLMFL